MIQRKQHLLLGAHISIAGGFYKAIERGAAIGCTTIQIFTKSNRQWAAKKISDEEIDLFKKTRRALSINPIIAHASYLINIASPNTDARQKSAHALQLELERCEQLGIEYLVLHPGANLNGSMEESLDLVATTLDEILETVPGNTKILLEIMAGQGSTICSNFEQIAAIRSKSHHKKRVGVCFDTCHAFTAGYDFRSEKHYEAMWKQFDAIVGIEHIYAIHLNDSKKGLGSHVDRHENIGKGELGLQTFELLMNDKRFFDVPKILETPYETLEDYIPNIKTLKNLLSTETRKNLSVTEE